MCGVISIAFALLLSPAPPLTDDQQRELAAARDDADYQEQAFYALVQSVRAWPTDALSDDEAIRLAPDFAAMLKNPAAYRGDLCRVTGELLQHTSLAPPYEDVVEWFVRDERGGMPVIVYVVQPETDQTFHERQHVQIDGRFYKRMRFAARDGKVREYPAFVGRFPVVLPAVAAPTVGHRGLDLLAVLAGPVVLLVMVLLGVRAWASRKRRVNAERLREGRAMWIDAADDDVVDDAAGLPDDPANALTELRRRAVEASSDHARDQGQSSA
jgi:hypothetical protein